MKLEVNKCYQPLGLLHVYLSNKWTPVCNETFGGIEADSSCRPLGYTGAKYYNGTYHQDFKYAHTYACTYCIHVHVYIKEYTTCVNIGNCKYLIPVYIGK